MRKIIAFLLAVVLLAVGVCAYVTHIDMDVAKLRCGNNVRDAYELCDEGGDDLCDDIAEWLSIDTQCDPKTCTCLPPINKAFCGNDRREGVELCDGTSDDFCPELGKLMGLNLTCNDDCGCDFAEAIPKSYDPAYVEELEEQGEGFCGNKVLDPNEECDPPNSLCTTALGEPGICDKNCSCVTPETILREEEQETEENVTANVTEAEGKEGNITVNVTEPVENASANITGAEELEKPGFFARLWSWIVSLFS